MITTFHLGDDVDLIETELIETCLVGLVVSRKERHRPLAAKKHKLAIVIAHHVRKLGIERFLLTLQLLVVG